MAEILVWRFEFIDDNPGGTYVTGDVIDVYYDPDNDPTPTNLSQTGYAAYLNGSPLASGPTIETSNTGSYLIEQNQNAQICNGTTKVQPIRFINHPYAGTLAFPGDNSCDVGGGVCDLIITGVPIVVPASDSGTPDGQITISATSSNAIQYKLGSDFSYNDGSGHQPTGTFGTLLPGAYRIYVRDSANCGTNILVEVGVNNTYSTKYRLEYTDLNGFGTRIDVVERAYSGAITEVCGTGDPFEVSLRAETEVDPFYPILPTDVVLRLLSTTNFQFTDIYTNDPNKLRILYYKDYGTVVPEETYSIPALADWITYNHSLIGYPWSTGANPNVQITESNNSSQWLRGTFPIPEGTSKTFSYDFDVTGMSGTPSITLSVYLVTSDFQIIKYDSVTVSAEGNYTGSFNPVLIAAEDADTFYVAIIASMTGNGYASVDINSFTTTDVTIPEYVLGYELKHTSRVQPFQYGEAYRGVPYPVEVVASDGLASLKDYPFVRDDGEKFKGTVKAIQLIGYILRKTGLSLNIRVGINMYATGMATSDFDDPLDQAYIDYQAYYLAEDEPTMEFVLRAILSTFKARVTQWNNVWNITRVQELVGQFDYREFDPNGVYSDNGNNNFVKSVVGVYKNFVNADHQMNLTNGYGKIKLRYALGLKSNVLDGCDFQLTSNFNNQFNTYEYKIDSSGWQLVTPTYPIISTFEQIDERNVALALSGGPDTTGESYVITEPFTLKMGLSNSIRLKIRLKIPYPNDGFTYFSVPYQKVRFQVTYGSYYLYANGTWSTTANTLTEYVTEFNKYTDIEVVAGPPSGASSGYTFQVKVYHSYVYHGEHASFAALKAVPTASGAIPVGKNTEVRISGSPDFVYFYELKSGTNSESSPGILLPDDYNASTNAVYWEAIRSLPVGPTTAFTANMYIDYINLMLLDGGREPVDTILRYANAEPGNTLVLDEVVYHGSYQTLINTALSFNIQIGIIDPLVGPTSLKTFSVLSADALYTGYFRDSNGDGYISWTRDGVAESATMHAIILSQLAAQYGRSYRRLSGSFSWPTEFGLTTVLRETGDQNRLYLPMGVTINDKMSQVTGQYVELIDITESGGSDGSGSAPFSSGFTVGFGQAAFN